MSSPHPIQTEDIDNSTKPKRHLKWLWICGVLLAILTLTNTGLLGYVVRQKSKEIEDLQFNQFVNDDLRDNDYVSPTVNTIQFLHKGYSITFDTVQYTQDGLLLGGNIGNETQLWISSLALNFAARPYPYKIRDKWAKSKDFFLYSSEYDIGSAQTSVGILNPGHTAHFLVTIPNVKQTSDEIRIAVRFSGERYQYL